jgi:hypothetical protein
MASNSPQRLTLIKLSQRFSIMKKDPPPILRDALLDRIQPCPSAILWLEHLPDFPFLMIHIHLVEQ